MVVGTHGGTSVEARNNHIVEIRANNIVIPIVSCPNYRTSKLSFAIFPDKWTITRAIYIFINIIDYNMAVEQVSAVDIGTGRTNWIASGIAGILAGIVFGLLAMALMPDMMGMVGAMYGFEGNEIVGWIAHLFHSLIFGLLYAAIVTLDTLRGYANRVAYGAGLGLVYAIIVWIVAASIVMPLWLGMPEMVPDFNPMSAVGHAVYGIILGATYPLLIGWLK